MNIPTIKTASPFPYTQVIDDESSSIASSKGKTSFSLTIHWKSLITALGSAGLFSAASAFYIVIAKRDSPAALPWPLAFWLSRNENLSTLLITVIATALSMLSTYLLASAIRYTVAVFLSRSMTVFMLGFSIQISNQSLIFHRDYLRWTLIGLVYLVATGLLTAGWSVLLTPTHILVQTPLTGRDIDLTSPNFNQFFQNAMTDADGFLDLIPLYSSAVAMSGETGANGASGFPLLLNFAQRFYNISTAGTHPAYIGVDDVHMLNRSDDALWSNEMLPQGLNSNFTLLQQGFTADVECTVKSLDETTNPALTTSLQTSVISDPESIGSNITTNATLFSWRWMTMCDTEPAWSNSATTWNNNTIVGFGCPNPSNGTNDFTLLIFGQGNYTIVGSVVCNISPKITSVKVEYGQTVQTTVIDPMVTNDPAEILVISQIAMGVLQRQFSNRQNLNTNDVGEAFWGILGNMNTTASELEPFNQDMLEGFITGILEFSATMYRANAFFSANYGANHNEIDLHNEIINMTTNHTGNYTTETLGYNHDFGSNLLILLPLMFVSLTTIGLIALAHYERLKIWHKQRSGGHLPASERVSELDVGDPFHLMAASSGLYGAFSGRPELVMREGRKIRVTLADDESEFLHVI